MDPTYQGLPPTYPTQRPRSRGISGRLLLLLAGALIVIIAAVVLLVNSGDPTGPLQPRLIARLNTLQKMIDEGEKNIKDPDLRTINSTVSIQVISETATIDSTFKSNGMKKPDKATTAAESDQSSFDSLKDAALNNRFDSAYRKTLAQKLDSTSALMREIYDKSSNKKIREALDQSYGHFKQLESQLAETSS